MHLPISDTNPPNPKLKVVHVAYVPVRAYSDSRTFLHRIDFFTVILKAMATYFEVISIHIVPFSSVESIEGVEYHFLPIDKYNSILGRRINRYVSALRPDVVFIHGLIQPHKVLTLSTRLSERVRLFVVHHGELASRFPVEILQQIADRRTTGYCFSSALMARAWLERRQISSLEKVHEIMEVSSIFEPNTTDRPDQTFIWVGRADKNKDPETLVRAFSQYLALVPHARLTVVLAGERLTPLFKELPNNNFELYRNVQHEAMAELFRRNSFVISTSHHEAGGTAVCEAMCCGCIPILTDIPSFRMMTDQGKVGLLFPPGDKAALYESLSKTLSLQKSAERSRVVARYTASLSPLAIAGRIKQIIKA